MPLMQPGKALENVT